MKKNYKKIGVCKLCYEHTTDLRIGHIYPRWSYTIGNLKIGSFVSMKKVDLLKEVNKRWKSAPTDYLFCGPCEEWLGKGEDELRRAFLTPNSKRGKSLSTIQMKDFPYFQITAPKKELIERAIVGIIYKAHFINESLFATVKLSETQLEMLRESILRNGSKSDNFEFLNMLFIKMYDFGKTFKVKEGPMAFHALTFSGDEVGLFFAGLAIQIDISATPRFKSGTEYLHVAIADITHLGFPLNGFPNFSLYQSIGNSEKNIEYLKEFIKTIDDDELCPCGHSWTDDKKLLHRKKFKECCKTMWFSELIPPLWYGFQTKLPPVVP